MTKLGVATMVIFQSWVGIAERLFTRIGFEQIGFYFWNEQPRRLRFLGLGQSGLQKCQPMPILDNKFKFNII